MNQENENNTLETNTIHIPKTDKIDFRLPSEMKSLISDRATQKGQKISQFIVNLLSEHFEQEKKVQALALEAKKQRKLNAEKLRLEDGEKSKLNKIESKKGDEDSLFHFTVILILGLALIYVMFKNLKLQKILTKIKTAYPSAYHNISNN
ncbi:MULTISPECIES: hypothetical protein [unclassified Arcicella]|uniref:hypothetical protein n=1 Tax=unclassified Arcicella TaxID=2644986 RepID=UPI00285D8767|nr:MULTISPECIES: hypothetical protein [unclassified Arcicella]MDR6561282.1 uncharacterized protein (DUF1778 family) [Arcicella sp. BE51]MDR6811166.1 uncharacterized protein (DUF1778 family) [Arcicella sp. BE140]MDR6822516.1 uncharacterized protein (DUF1778 family) [Arcicella sp. BE139]